jgi:hypothetical protein
MAGDGCSTNAGGRHVNNTRRASPAIEAARCVTGPGSRAGDGDAVRVVDPLREGVIDVVADVDGVFDDVVVRLADGPSGVTDELHIVTGPAP